LAGLRETVERSIVDSTDPQLGQYLKLKLSGRGREELHAIFVDHHSGFMAEELVSIGNGHQVEARIASIVRRAIELGAHGLVLFHNHPSGDAEPSLEDIRATRKIKSVASALGIIVIDHLIVARNAVVSMKSLNLL